MTVKKALLMLIVALLLAYFARQTPSKSATALPPADPPVFADFAADHLSTLEIVDARQHLLLGRLNGEWTFLSPAGRAVKTRQLERLLQTLGALKIRGRFRPVETLTAYGLGTPELSLNFQIADSTHSLRFGKKHSLTGRRYALVDEELEVFLLDDYDFETLKTLTGEAARSGP